MRRPTKTKVFLFALLVTGLSVSNAVAATRITTAVHGNPINGVFQLQVRPLGAGEWQNLGSVLATRFVRPAALAIPPVLRGQTVELKVNKLGGGNSHLDVLTIDGQALQVVTGLDALAQN